MGSDRLPGSPAAAPGSQKIEQELKLLLDPQVFSAEAVLAALAAQPGLRLSPPQTVRVHDVYLDTREGALARAGLSARWRRRQGKASLQVKPVPLLPGLLLERIELHRDLTRREDAVAALRLLLEERLGLRVGRLLPELELRSTRQVRKLELRVEGAGSPAALLAELSLDQVTALRPGARSGPGFQELELELLEGSPERLRALAGWLASQPGLTSSGRSKHRRARELLGMPGARLLPPAPRFGPLASADEVARLIGSAQLQTILAYQPGTRLGLDPEYLHKMRVGTRRLRAALRALADCFPAAPLRALQRELSWLAGLLGEVRDLDVQLLQLDERRSWLGSSPEAGWLELRQVLEERRRQARQELLRGLDGPRQARLLARARKLFEPAPGRRGDHPGRRPVIELAAEVLSRRARKLARAVRACRRAPGAEALHRLRILGKKLRYACELFTPLYGPEFKEAVGRLSGFQDRLGRFQDSVVSGAQAERLRDQALAAAGSPSLLHVLGLLIGASRAALAVAPHELELAYQELGGASSVRWLGRQARQRAAEVKAALLITGGLPASSSPAQT